MKFSTKLALTISGLIVGYVIGNAVTASAHPCEDDYEVCGYEMEVDPQTGKLESVYVCH